jgi:hypothetical protein
MGFYSSFVVKLWLDDDGKIIWGQIKHVDTQESIHFRSLDKMLLFMEEHQIPPANGFAEDTSACGAITFQRKDTQDE